MKELNATGAWPLVVVPRVVDAIDRVRTERDQLTAEQTAFDEFTKRVAALDPENRLRQTKVRSISSATGLGVTATAGQAGQYEDESNLATGVDSAAIVREAYRDTVMAVPHYTDEYGESLEENLAAELSPQVVRALSENEIMTQQFQAVIINQSQQASKQRKDLLNHVDSEYEALIAARRQLRDLYEMATTIEDELYPRPIHELVQSWKRLETKATDCKALLRKRQQQINSDNDPMLMLSLQRYLYQPFQWRHPVLNDGVNTLSRIRQAKQSAVEAIYNW